MFLHFFFLLTNIYRPSLGKLRLGRPNPKLHQPLNFYLRRRKKRPFYSELYALHHCRAQFSILIFIYFLKKIKLFLSKKPVKILNNIYNNNFFLNRALQRCCEVFADVNTIYFTVLRWIMNVWIGFETFKTQLLGKQILIIFLLWKWIKYIFVLKGSLTLK